MKQPVHIYDKRGLMARVELIDRGGRTILEYVKPGKVSTMDFPDDYLPIKIERDNSLDWELMVYNCLGSNWRNLSRTDFTLEMACALEANT